MISHNHILKALLIAGLVFVSTPAFAQEDGSVKGSAGIGASKDSAKSVSGSAGVTAGSAGVSTKGSAGRSSNVEDGASDDPAEQVVSSVSVVGGCQCVTCGDEFTNLKKAKPIFCGAPDSVETFLGRVDKDKSKDGIVCRVEKGPDNCPLLGYQPKFKQSACKMAESDVCNVTESADSFGISCRAECCGANGCVAPDWQQRIEYLPFTDVQLSSVQEKDRDAYFANRTNMVQALSAKTAKPIPYKGPQILCDRYSKLSALNATTCVGAGGRLDIVFGEQDISLTFRNGVTPPESTTLKYGDLTDEEIMAVPYPYRGKL